MGYTQYWRRPSEHPLEDWKKFTAGVKKIIDAAKKKIKIAGGSGSGHPEISDEQIDFNGDGVEGLDHETFYIPRVLVGRSPMPGDDRGLIFQFCKTACKPYDEVVVAVLILYKKCFPKVGLSSDGGVADWKDGKLLFEKAMKTKVNLFVDGDGMEVS